MTVTRSYNTGAKWAVRDEDSRAFGRSEEGSPRSLGWAENAAWKRWQLAV